MPIPDLTIGSSLRAAADQMADGPIAYLLGAGASAAAGLPPWGTLLRRLLQARGLDEFAAGRLLAAQDNLLVAEAAFAPRIRRATRDGLIYRALYGTDDTSVATRDFTPSNLHFAVAHDAFRRGHHDTTLMTLNYDDLQEEALVKVAEVRHFRDPHERVHGRASTKNRATSAQFEVHHLHGLLPRESQASVGDGLVLTLSDYARVMDDSWQRDQVREAVRHGPMLMLGTSYSDPDIRTWLGTLRSRDRHQLLAVISRPAFGITRAQMDVLRPVILAQWQSVGVRALIVDDYATPTQIVRELAFLGRDDYAPPSERVSAVLAACEANFADQQVADADVLASQAKRFTRLLGEPAALTLWLHDGHDKLVRWATSDRTYRDAASLRRIDADSDSGWIAANAVCNDTEVIRDIDVRTAELSEAGLALGPGTTTGRWVMVGARPLVAALPKGPPVTVGALSVASAASKDEVDIVALQKALDAACASWEKSLKDRG